MSDPDPGTGRTSTMVFVLAVVVVGFAVAPATATATQLQQQSNNTTATVTPTATSTPRATPTPTPTATPSQEAQTCEVRAGGPKIQQARLYSPEPAVREGEPGRISGTISVDIQNECPVVVQLTLTVQSGMYLAGAGDLSSGGGGVITSVFEVQPGEVKDLAGHVYSSSTGQKSVSGSITYYPKGHKDMAREIDGLRSDFDVQEEFMPGDPQPPNGDQATTSTQSPTPTADGSGSGLDGIIDRLLDLLTITTIGLIGLVALGFIGIVKAVPNVFDFDFEFLNK